MCQFSQTVFLIDGMQPDWLLTKLQRLGNSSKLFVTIGLLTGVILGVIENPAFGLLNGLLFGGAAALIGGRGAGIVCIEHFILRCILWQRGYIPWNYARFLDYAADCIFLQKVGEYC